MQWLITVVKQELARLHLLSIAQATVTTVVILGGILLVIYLCEPAPARRARYRSRVFLNDVCYTLFYRGGFFTVLIMAWITAALQPHTHWARLNLVDYLPRWAAYVVWWVVVDFLAYWIHRLQHTSRFLWAFHSIHHVPEQMTALTSYRFHVVEQVISSLLMFIPALALGVPPQAWLPFVILQTFFEAIQHADLDWRFGRLYPLLVSPVFHAFHHSAARRHYDRNFAKIFSVWDVMFGTAVIGEERPRVYGVDGLHVRESLVDQFVSPFRQLRDRAPAPPAVAPAADGPAAASAASSHVSGRVS
jgi:sterol desaturase/sphingolipid hydroxylase (fatty acid hydroxylase superfamily)